MSKPTFDVEWHEAMQAKVMAALQFAFVIGAAIVLAVLAICWQKAMGQMEAGT